MPVITIRSLPFEHSVDIPSLLKKLNRKVALAIGYDENHIWSTWEYLKPDHYAVGGGTAESSSLSKFSPLVRILSFEGKSKSDIEKMLKATADVLSMGLQINLDNIFIEYVEARSGMVFDGGQVLRKK